jgi:hypothetical protein
VRRFQVHLTGTGVEPSSINQAATALRFFFAVTLGRSELALHLARVHYPRKLVQSWAPAFVTETIQSLRSIDRAGTHAIEQSGLALADRTEDEIDAATALLLLRLGRRLSRREVDPIDNQFVDARPVTRKLEKVVVPPPLGATLFDLSRGRSSGSEATAASYVPSRLTVAYTRLGRRLT